MHLAYLIASGKI